MKTFVLSDKKSMSHNGIDVRNTINIIQDKKDKNRFSIIIKTNALRFYIIDYHYSKKNDKIMEEKENKVSLKLAKHIVLKLTTITTSNIDTVLDILFNVCNFDIYKPMVSNDNKIKLRRYTYNILWVHYDVKKTHTFILNSILSSILQFTDISVKIDRMRYYDSQVVINIPNVLFNDDLIGAFKCIKHEMCYIDTNIMNSILTDISGLFDTAHYIDSIDYTEFYRF